MRPLRSIPNASQRYRSELVLDAFLDLALDDLLSLALKTRTEACFRDKKRTPASPAPFLRPRPPLPQAHKSLDSNYGSPKILANVTTIRNLST